MFRKRNNLCSFPGIRMSRKDVDRVDTKGFRTMRSQLVLPAVVAAVLFSASTSQAQLLPNPQTVLPSPTFVNGMVTIGNTVLQPDTAATQEELPGLGHKFEQFGS